MRINQFKKYIAIILLAGISFFSSLFAEDITFYCYNSGIPLAATGKYRCDDSGKIFYRPLNGEELDLFSIMPPVDDDPNVSLIKITACRNVKDLFHNDFYNFDNHGNLYFVANARFHKWQAFEDIENVTYIYKFNPTENSISYFRMNENSTPNSFCVSDDGTWAFLDTIEIIDVYREIYISRVYAIPTNFKSTPKLIYSSAQTTKMNHLIRNITFSPSSQMMFISTLDNKIYALKTDEAGNFSTGSFYLNNTNKNSYMIQTNNEGLWGITADEKNPKTSAIVHLADNNGNPLNVKENRLRKKIKGDWRFNPAVSIKADYILFVSDDGTKIYKYANRKIENATNLLPEKSDYKLEDLESVYEYIESKQNDSLETKLLKKQITFFVVIIIVLLIIIAALISCIFYLTKKSNKIRKDKQFIYNIQEAERGKISRDVHDSIIQDIRAIRIESDLLNVSPEDENRKNKIINLATDCVVKLRNICYNLTPAELATHNDGDSSKIELISMIQSLVLQFIERTHVPCQIKVDENFNYPVLEKEISQNLFRIIQEALNNIEKHSYATSCQILIKNREENGKDFMLIYISDDGVGCDVKQLIRRRSRTHFGIRNMMDRASLIGAQIDFQSEPGQGLEVRIKI